MVSEEKKPFVQPWCKNGLAAKGKRCSENGLESCARCDDGFVNKIRHVKDHKNRHEHKEGLSSRRFGAYNVITTCVREETDVNSQNQ